MNKLSEILNSGRARLVSAAALFVVAFVIGAIWRGSWVETQMDQDQMTGMNQSEKTAEVWTCSMHPQIKLPKPGKCPICFMDLIPMTSGDDDSGPRELSVSENSAKLMEIETSPVERRFVTSEVRMIGKVDYDETRVSYITAWIPGRIDRMYVDYTGVPVKKGDHMVYLYSPELLGAQEELLQAVKAGGQIDIVREKLRLWGLTPEQISEIEKRGKPDDHMTVYAPAGGIVIQKNAQEGMYVSVGTRIYTIADLSKVWVSLDAYESDLAWLRYGQAVEFTVESYPGEVFKGIISFIHPVLNEATRTVKVRVNVPNEDGRLKPGMFVSAMAKAEIATDGRIVAAALAGKWICPMHPEIVKDESGKCDTCEMPLVRAERLGYVGAERGDKDKPLVIPATAALLTGKRAVVYVELQGKHKPTFEGRDIELGPRAGDYYLVKSGLEEGERVVTKGNFKIDAELQIRAKPSMMMVGTEDRGQRTGDGGQRTGDGGQRTEVRGLRAEVGNVPAVFRDRLAGVVRAYYGIQKALAGDDPAALGKLAGELVNTITAIETDGLSDKAAEVWHEQEALINKTAGIMGSEKVLQEQREAMPSLTAAIEALVRTFGPFPGLTVRKAFCPMAFDNKGAFWLQEGETIENPYFGDMMLRCGEIKEVLK